MNLRVQLQSVPNINMFEIHRGHVDVEVLSIRDAFYTAVDQLKLTTFPELDYEDWTLLGIEDLEQEE